MASEYLKWKYRDVKPREKVELTAEEKRRNWWDYHKWHVLIAALLFAAVFDIGKQMLHIGEVRPDVQIAYVGEDPLPGDTVSALEGALSSFIADANGDGKTIVRVVQYAGSAAGGQEAAAQAEASHIKLLADLEECESFLFLLENPETFQTHYQVLSYADGSLPDEEEYEMDKLCCRWTDCPALSALSLGSYREQILGETIQGESRQLLADLFIARRGFWTEQTSDNPEMCEKLWREITKGAVQ